MELQRAVTRSIVENAPGRPESSRPKEPLQRFAGSHANWDPSYQSENINWYDEYIARHAVLSMTWLEQPKGGIDGLAAIREIRGLAFKNDGGNNVIAPLEDGSVCVWNINLSDGLQASKRGQILARSKPGLLLARGSADCIGKKPSPCNPNVTAPSIVECVSIDPTRNRAYIAVEQGLNEVDLTTLQLVSHQEFESPIAALSDISAGVPLTVATNPSVHVHDPRMNHHRSSESAITGRVEKPIASVLLPSNKSLYQVLRSQKSLYGPHQGPLAVVHLPASNGLHDAQNGAIYVAGRDPSILVHDRRVFPKLSHTIHSGAHLSSLAIIAPPAFEGATFSSGDPQCKVVACGEYKGKGSLELYDPPHLSALPLHANASTPFKNRTSASSSKLLSVTSHGARILFSDSNGMLKWVERDGSTLVRRWDINQHQPHRTDQGIFAPNSGFAEEHVARKVLRTGDAGCSDDGVLFWTGERIGLVGFRPERVCSELGKSERREGQERERERVQEQGGDGAGDAEDEGEGEGEGQGDLESRAELYRDRMRRALNRQADEVRFVRGLGLGG